MDCARGLPEHCWLPLGLSMLALRARDSIGAARWKAAAQRRRRCGIRMVSYGIDRDRAGGVPRRVDGVGGPSAPSPRRPRGDSRGTSRGRRSRRTALVAGRPARNVWTSAVRDSEVSITDVSFYTTSLLRSHISGKDPLRVVVGDHLDHALLLELLDGCPRERAVDLQSLH